MDSAGFRGCHDSPDPWHHSVSDVRNAQFLTKSACASQAELLDPCSNHQTRSCPWASWYRPITSLAATALGGSWYLVTNYNCTSNPLTRPLSDLIWLYVHLEVQLALVNKYHEPPSRTVVLSCSAVGPSLKFSRSCCLQVRDALGLAERKTRQA